VIKAAPDRRRRPALATFNHNLRRQVWGCALALALLLTVRADRAAAQNQPPASPTVFSDARKITDLGFFVDVRDKTKWFYLPRYRLAVQTVSGDQQYRVRFSKQGTAANLEVYLEKQRAPGLGDDLLAANGEQAREMTDALIRAAQELPHRVEVLVRYDLPTREGSGQASAYKELVFQEVTLERDGLKAVLRLDDLRERDALIHALGDPKFDARLLVRRTLTVLSIPWQEREASFARLQEMDGERDVLTMKARFCGELSAPEFNEKYRKFLANDNSGAMAVAFKASCDVIEAGFKLHRDELAAQRKPLFAKYLELSKKVPVTAALDDVVRQSFSFDRTLHSYVFAGIIPNPGSKPQLVRSQVSWQNRYYSYFRPTDRDDLWYYLPDRFVLGEEKQTPRLKVRFAGTPEAQTVELEYVAVPQTDPARLKAAEAELRPTANSSVTFEPLLADEAQLWVAPPGVGNDGPYHQRPGASVDLRDGLRDQVKLTLDEFKQIYAALFSASHTLFTGEVRLDLGGLTRELIPFEARAAGQPPEALWDKILSRADFTDYQKTIRVKTPALVFGTEVKFLVTDFKEGETVELSQGKLEASVKVRLPMRDFILNTEGSGQYHYKVTAIRERGGKSIKTEMPSWKTSTETILYPEVPQDVAPGSPGFSSFVADRWEVFTTRWPVWAVSGFSRGDKRVASQAGAKD
jgi:hypothetical protein